MRPDARRHIARLATTTVAVLATWAAAAAAASAAEPQVLASAAASCSAGSESRLSFPAFPVTVPAALTRVTMISQSGPRDSWNRAQLGDAEASVAGDVAWGTTGPLRAGDVVSGWLSCSSKAAMSATADVLDVPTAPTAFAGVSTPGAASSTSSLAFNVPADGQYRVTVDVSQGAVQVGFSYDDWLNVVSHAEHDVHIDDSNANYDKKLTVMALDGPQARYTVTVVALPVAVTGPTVAPAAAKPGTVVTVGYALSGQATVSARVLAPDGTVVRPLADALAVQRGERSLRWDGLTATGTDVPSGQYTVALDVTDATGTRSFTAPVRIDSTPPEVRLPAGQRLSRKRALVVTVADPVVGVSRARMTVNGRRAGRLEPGGRIVYRPARGWPAKARLNVKVTAIDRLGNQRTVRRVYRTR